jgi:hypothetical protein
MLHLTSAVLLTVRPVEISTLVTYAGKRRAVLELRADEKGTLVTVEMG